LKEAVEKMKPILTEKCPFVNPPDLKEKIQWVQPKLVCEVEYAELTPDDQLRQTTFLGWRDDKKAKDVVLEQPRTGLPERHLCQLLPSKPFKSESSQVLKIFTNKPLPLPRFIFILKSSTIACHNGKEHMTRRFACMLGGESSTAFRPTKPIWNNTA